MADTFYTVKEAAEKLGKSENALKDMVKNGELREYRDGTNVLFKTEDVDKLAIGDIDLLAEADETNLEVGPAETGEISLASSGGELNVDEDIFALTDTSSGTGPQGSSINILGETDSEFKISEDTKSETKSLKLGSETGPGEAKLEDDVNLDSFGSGSGLLDLSLQADDTSLGAEVLEDIYSPDAGAQEQEAAEAPMPLAEAPTDMAAEADKIFDSAVPTEEAEAAPAIAAAVAAAPVYPMAPAYAAAPEAVDPRSGVFSALLLIGLLVMIFTMIVAFAGAQGISTALFRTFSGGMLIWYVVAGLMGASLVVLGIGTAVTGKSSAPKTAKAPKAPKVKKKK
ncbi:MAG TPA: helix-turn-helix domain-containing protein [Sedimentisphaerales bacterium]|nr:helix-turn-helix domain-containing protein [Sedimentisphaerales bacterium]